jgi:hypothetical protein
MGLVSLSLYPAVLVGFFDGLKNQFTSLAALRSIHLWAIG